MTEVKVFKNGKYCHSHWYPTKKEAQNVAMYIYTDARMKLFFGSFSTKIVE